MKRILALGLVAAGVVLSFGAAAQTVIKVGWCARTVTSGAAPFAIATRMGWFKNEGIEVELVPNAGSIDCTPIFFPFRSLKALIGLSAGTAMP